MVSAYWLIGKRIVEDDQQGQSRAVYGKALMQKLSKTLQSEFGKGFSVDNLENMRRFYISYSAVELGPENKAALESLISETVSRKSQAPEFNLSWSHYLMLTSIKDMDERRFYEIESIENNWSLREVKRQYNSGLFMRLALSTDKELHPKEVVKLLL